MKRSCDTCEWLQTPQRACAESNPWKVLPPEQWCGRWRLDERLSQDPTFSTARSE